ncbi:hypothetical protein Hokovirus_3_88 [Hokovirus HKV1]|uniref:Uncharacterized protein n=1 Tax=Hokovirus HKV1 TaxID=1977638 RepID=A0A1V0SGG9_9VIRU|nr:hypothetical protein Hokovirus_3_88 [Hokovirus HKV1]
MNILIKQIINNNFKTKYSNLLEHLEKQDQDQDQNQDQELINNIKNILTNISNIKEIVQEVEKNDTQIAEEDVQNYIYNKEWSKLANVHKMIKIREYFKYMADTDYKQKIINDLEILVNNNKLKNDKHVIYNKKTKSIIDIPVLILQPTFDKGYIINITKSD